LRVLIAARIVGSGEFAAELTSKLLVGARWLGAAVGLELSAIWGEQTNC